MQKKIKRPRVAFFLPTPGGMTGAPRRLLTLMKALQDNYDFDVALVGDPLDRLTQEAANEGIKILEVPTGPILSLKHGMLLRGTYRLRLQALGELVKYNLKMAKALRKFNPDAIWIRGSKGIAFGGLAAYMLHRPLIWDIDNDLPSKGIIAFLYDIGLRMSSKVVLQYTRGAEFIFGQKKAARFRNKFISLIPGIDFSRLKPYRELRNRLISEGVFSSSHVFRILQVGTLTDNKNQRFTLRVINELKRGCPNLNVELMIVGDVYEKDYETAIQYDLDKLGLRSHVQLLGWRDDVPELIARSDLLVLPSKGEGVPNVIQEAMYIGCPVLASDVGGIPEIIENGRTGWILPIDQPSLWAEKISDLILQPEKRFQVSKEAALYAERNFTAETWAKKYSSLFHFKKMKSFLFE